MSAKPENGHRWSFYRAGGVDQVKIESGADILNLDKLDLKLWIALSCPVKGVEFDERTLALLDADGDGHVRSPELLSAIQWLGACLRNADELVEGADGIALSSIDGETPAGHEVMGAARHILTLLGKKETAVLTVKDMADTAEKFAKADRNGDGVVPPDTIADAAVAKAAAEVLDCVGGVDDRSGKPGIDVESIRRFFTECEKFAAWHDRAAADADSVLPLGDATQAAFAAFDAVRAKVDDYFARCRLAAFDSRAVDALNREEQLYVEIAAGVLSASAEEVEGFPLAAIEGGKALALDGGVNPAWAARIAAFRSACVEPMLGEQKSLSESQWAEIRAELEAHRGWLAAKEGAAVEKLGVDRVRELLAGDSRDRIVAEIEADLQLRDEFDAIVKVERLVRYYRDICKLLSNFVSFTDFYARRGAIFQAGTLYLDSRACDLCIEVTDAAKHGKLAVMSACYIAYCDCARPGGETKKIAAAFTSGDSDNLFVGRNGVFFDRAGRDWEATITRIVDNPISIPQAFWSPYKKLIRWIEQTVAKRAAAADEAAAARLRAGASSAATAAQTGETPDKPKFDVGVVAALGVAVGGITAALGALLDAFFGLGYLMPLGLLGLLLLISGPSMVIAWLKLRRRNLGPLLDANGWAVNALTKVNIPLGASLTDVAELPAGAHRSLHDPFAPKKRLWPRLLLLVIVLGAVGFGLWRTGYLHRWWPACPLPEPETGAPADPGKREADQKGAAKKATDKK